MKGGLLAVAACAKGIEIFDFFSTFAVLNCLLEVRSDAETTLFCLSRFDVFLPVPWTLLLKSGRFVIYMAVLAI